jgi:hypothetical protein
MRPARRTNETPADQTSPNPAGAFAAFPRYHHAPQFSRARASRLSTRRKRPNKTQ